MVYFFSLLQVFAEPDGTQVLEPQLRAELLNYTEQSALVRKQKKKKQDQVGNYTYSIFSLQASRDLQRFRDTDHNIVQALKNIGKAKEIIKVTLNFVPFDLFGGSIIDEQQIIYIEGKPTNQPVFSTHYLAFTNDLFFF